ncbi:MAG: acyltransferase [Deltaproteobacteria bacterium]|nr:acyltransferase [Deltaproteobacteria bacterium]
MGPVLRALAPEHTWSLAIEEQFYLLWPIIVLPVLRWRSPRALLAVAVTLALASMVTMAALFDPENSSRVYLGTDTRASGILIGACFAIVLRPDTTFAAKKVWRLDLLGVGALLLLGVTCINPPLRRAVSAVGGLRLLDLAEIQCPKGKCTTTCDGETTRPDGVHYDIEGARAIAQRTIEQLRNGPGSESE